jgi:FkbM family methyltransferase
VYSQNDEERVILEYFGDTAGRLYDIGAWTGMQFSNTRALLERGWMGVLVEPSPTAFVSLMANTAAFAERVTLVNAAVTKESSLATFYDSAGDAVSTLNTTHRDKWQSAVTPMRPITIHTISARSLFGAFGSAQFINLDVEGMNMDLFRCLPLDWPDLKMVCAEFEKSAFDMTVIAAEHGFHKIHQNHENIILAKPK